MTKSKRSAFILSFIISFLVAGTIYLNWNKPKPENILLNSVFKQDDSQVKLSEIEGELFLVNFWASWCEPCKEEMPQFIELEKMYLQKGFKVILVNVDEDRKAALDFLNELNTSNSADMETYFDKNQNLVEKFNVTAVPASYLIKKTGDIVFSTDGLIDWLSADIIGKIEEPLAEK